MMDIQLKSTYNLTKAPKSQKAPILKPKLFSGATISIKVTYPIKEKIHFMHIIFLDTLNKYILIYFGQKDPTRKLAALYEGKSF